MHKKQQFWQIHLPNLLFQLLRALVVLGVIAYVLAQIWKINLIQVMGALGIGSLVIALALQDTLSNLVSGFLLIIDAGDFEQALYILLSGRFLLSVEDRAGQKEIAQLSEGDFFGEMVFLPGELSPTSATVIETAKAISIAPDAIAYLTRHHPKFALEMSQFIDERKKLIRIAEGIESVRVARY